MRGREEENSCVKGRNGHATLPATLSFLETFHLLRLLFGCGWCFWLDIVFYFVIQMRGGFRFGLFGTIYYTIL
jgi:hypothetical protein